MKAAFVCGMPETIHRVYGPRQREAIEARAELLPGVFDDWHDPALRDVEVLFSTWGMPCLTEADIREYLPALRCVFYAAGSVQKFARPFLHCGVRVFSAWQANGTAVAQFTFAQIELALKGYFTTQTAMQQGRARSRAVFEHYPGAYEVKVGLLGCGAIGSQVAELLRLLDVEVWVYDPFLPEKRAQELHVRKAELAEVFAECRVISNHLANLPATVGIIRREHLLAMKPYATFINTGRGAQLSEVDLYDALTLDPTRCALLDVLTEETRTDENPLGALPNCFITPHIAGANGHEVRRMAEYMIAAFDCVQAGKPSPCEVFEPMLATMA